jgi:hypothetical protein
LTPVVVLLLLLLPTGLRRRDGGARWRLSGATSGEQRCIQYGRHRYVQYVMDTFN